MDESRLAPLERARADEAVVRVHRGRSIGPPIVAALVVVAFLLGLLRPWDWLAGDGATGILPGGEGAVGAVGRGIDDGPAVDGGRDRETPSTEPFQAPTCGYPTSWRTAAVSFWAGARARVWTAAEAVAATGPDDPSIPFHPIASDRVEAIGWCAPITGPDRPPLAAVGTLFRVRDGVASEVAVDRLEPAEPDALGELWMPPAPTVGRRPEWAPGHYVIRLAVPSGSYARYLGLEVGVGDLPGAAPEPLPSRSPEPLPSRSPEPGPPALQVPGRSARRGHIRAARRGAHPDR
ncbi:MAG TPA: hypothetical protein VES19_15850 [Candidatus Limnocylindrales bacterium]|nr:hypothetical protein [Candidatus Limnocylindrales bacterium]